MQQPRRRVAQQILGVVALEHAELASDRIGRQQPRNGAAVRELLDLCSQQCVSHLLRTIVPYRDRPVTSDVGRIRRGGYNRPTIDWGDIRLRTERALLTLSSWATCPASE